MSIGIRAQFTTASSIPLDPLDLKEGAVVKLDVTEEAGESVLEATDRLLSSAPAGDLGQLAARRRRKLPALPVRPPEGGRALMAEIFADTG